MSSDHHSTSVAQALDRGLALHQAGHLAQAEQLYRDVLRQDPGNCDAQHLLGVIAHQAGNHDAAMDLIRRAIESNGDVALYHNSLGLALEAKGQREQAEHSYRRALTLDPGFSEAHCNLGHVLRAEGRHDEALPHYQQAQSLQPDFADSYCGIGLVHLERRRDDDAERMLQRALTLDPKHPAAHLGLGILQYRHGRLEQAVLNLQQAIAAKPDLADAHSSLGALHYETGKPDQAIDCFQRALAIDPHHARATYGLGRLYVERGNFAEGSRLLQRALELNPKYVEAHVSLGNALVERQEMKSAIAHFEAAIAIDPDCADAHNGLGIALSGLGDSAAAMRCFERALQIRPTLGGAACNLARELSNQGQIAEAIEHYRRLLVVDDDAPTMAVHNLLMALNYEPTLTPQAVFDEHVRWAAKLRAGAPPTIDHGNQPDPERRVRIGYVSPDFRQHSVAYFMEPILACHERDRFEVFCYSNVARVDDVTVRLQQLTEHWRNIYGIRDADVVRTIREDRIDILVDLAGHTQGTRLPVFVHRPAPIQISYLGYPNTTGLSEIDYRLSDPDADPPGHDKLYTETLLRLPRVFLSYRPLEPSPDVASAPEKSAGYITFASFNNPAKINPQVVATWATILNAVPGSRLMLKANGFKTDGPARSQYRELFAVHGITAERLDLQGWVRGPLEHLEMYHRADIALDSFPYNGTTTTCEALWMGVPVVTLAGDRHAGRVGMSLLKQVGLPELIARTRADYVNIAVELARDRARLSALRAGTRQRLHATLCDSKTFTRELEVAYREVWKKWCVAHGGASSRRS